MSHFLHVLWASLRTLSLSSRLCLRPSLPFVFTQKNDSLWDSGLLLWSLPHRPWPRAEPYPPSLLGRSGLGGGRGWRERVRGRWGGKQTARETGSSVCLCACVCAYVNTLVCTHMCLWACVLLHVFVSMDSFVDIPVCVVCVSMCLCVCVFLFVWPSVHLSSREGS